MQVNQQVDHGKGQAKYHKGHQRSTDVLVAAKQLRTELGAPLHILQRMALAGAVVIEVDLNAVVRELDFGPGSIINLSFGNAPLSRKPARRAI